MTARPSAPSVLTVSYQKCILLDPSAHSIALLGTFPSLSNTDYAIIRVEGTAFPTTSAPHLLANDLARADQLGNNDIVRMSAYSI